MNVKIIAGRFAALVALATSLATVPALAQSATGVVRGEVVDPSGAPMDAVTVVILNIETADRRELTTDRQGRFVAPLLPPGPYEVTAARAGFAVRRQEELELRPGRTETLRLELDAAAVPDTITIGPTPSVIDAAQSHAGGSVAWSEIQQLPLAERRVLDLARLIPGPAGPFLPGMVDGVDAGGQFFQLEAVRDLSVVTIAPPLEVRRPDGNDDVAERRQQLSWCRLRLRRRPATSVRRNGWRTAGSQPPFLLRQL